MFITRGTLILTLIFCSEYISCFNFEDRDPLVKKAPEDQKGSYFGFSVAQHSTLNLPSNQSDNEFWILVGAPLGKNLQPYTNQSGALFKCPISNYDDDCIQVETDGKRFADFDYDDTETDSSVLKPHEANEIKEGQWLGVTVKSQKPGGIVIVCAHRYIKSENLEEFHYGQGLCYLLDKDLNTYESLLLCKGRPMEKLHQQFGFCQVGTSASFVGDEFALLGAPGPYTWRGTVFGQIVVGEYLNRDKTTYHGPFGDIDIIDKYSYLGMSVGGGHFFSKTEYTYIAGAPRSKMVGQVYFFKKYSLNEDLNISLILTGEQFAASYGYEILAVDVNNDGYDDLLVGAPFYYSSEEKGGAVYIYYNIRNCVDDNHCHYDNVLYGKLESRFGFAMTSLGDINKDGYKDVAIGAPYENDYGAVYIYLGSANGLSNEPSQIIREKNIRALGYSLSGGLDMDNNGYPDLLVGAFESDRVLLFKARPIIDIKITVESTELLNINASKKGCHNIPDNNHTCFSFKTCFKVIGDIKKDAKFDVIYNIAEEKKIVNRIWFVDELHHDKRSPYKSAVVPVSGYSKLYCQEETVNLKDGVSDILTPIEFRVNYTLENNTYHTPILNKTSVKIIRASFQKECGSDDICESNLTLTASTDLDLDETGAYKVQIINEDFVLEVNVSNSGESAYEAKLFVVHPKTISYVTLKNDRNVSDGIKCLFNNETLVICNIGNPLQKNTKINLKLRFEISRDIKDPKLQLNMFVNSTSKELSKHTSETLVAVLMKIAKFQITGKASSNLFYGGKVIGESAVKYLDDIGAKVIHKYQIDNNGQWDLADVKVFIKWPLQVSPGPDYPDRPGKWLLYLENNAKLYGVDGFCAPLGTARPNELQLNTSKFEPDEPENLMLPSDFEQILNMSKSHSRSKRSTNYIVPYEVTEKGGKRRKIVIMDCFSGSAKCIDILCTIRKLNKGNQAEIDIQSRIWNSTLVEDYSNLDWVVIKSTATVLIEDGSFNISSDTISEYSAETIAYPAIVSADTELNWLIIGGAVFVGLLLLILLIFVLYKCGFFKRKRISDDPTLSGNLQKKSEADHLLTE
ncbi:integrin alpha-PS1-like isoform X2 [Diorhabda sublineata]|uniref:integrin alpha-PS1-like isoform X2 n=1 Tax=Diorhabda sublineata TaxID=1163346 RepID=UPI0024E12A53|nr:integrin alpha-PS1-like isoform X2 [Diorhabda sublineata]